MNDSKITFNNKNPFKLKQFLVHSLFFLFGFVLIILIFRIIALSIKIEIDFFWPISIFKLLIPGLIEIIITVGILIFFLFVNIFYYKRSLRLVEVIFISSLLIISTNLIHGISIGLANPIEGSLSLTKQLYDDAIQITNPLDFISNFEILQKELGLHAKTHPPGAVLLIFILYKAFYYPALISLAISLISSLISSLFLFGILKRIFKPKNAIWFTFLFLLLPSIQIYYLANIYALVTTFFLGVIYFYFYEDFKISILGSGLFLFLSANITFMTLFIGGVLLIYEFLSYKSLKNFKKLLILTIILIISFFFVFIFLKFNYINCFLIASKIENPNGLMLIVDPIEYLFTRIENILELIVFFGPFLSVLFFYGIRSIKGKNIHLYNMALSAIIMLLALFLIGAYRTGETARACMFMYPFLLFPIFFYLDKNILKKPENFLILFLIFGQSLLMQLFGFYFW